MTFLVCLDDLECRSVPEWTSAAEHVMEGRLRDLLLDIEDRIHQGTLGTLKVHTHTHTPGEHRGPGTAGDSSPPQVMDRRVWRSALGAGNYELLCSDGRMNARVDPTEVDSPVHLRARDRYADARMVSLSSR